MLTILFLFSICIFAFTSFANLAVATRASRVARQVALWLFIIANLGFLAFSLRVFISEQTFHIKLYELLPSLEFTFTVDRLAAFFALIVSLVSVSVSFYSMRYIEHHGTNTDKNIHVAMMGLFILSMLLLISSANTFSFLFFWELMSVTSFFLVISDRDKKETGKASIFYFVMTQMSTVFLLFAFLAMYSATGSFDIKPAEGLPAVLNTMAFLALFTGFGIKAGVMPFHKWLPYAHSASPSNISALMSGVMIKVAIYGLVRYIFFVLSPEWWWGAMVLAFGTSSALLGVIYALKEHDIKKLLAYHSIENVGIILIGIGLALIFQSQQLPELALLSLLGGLFHTLNHALFKSLLFLTAGAVVDTTGTRNIEEMGGLIKTMPWTGVLFLIGSVSIAALPPFNGFVSELIIFQAFLQSFVVTSAYLKVLLFIGLSLFALTSALAAACFVKAFGTIFLATPRSEEARKAHEVPVFMIIGSSILALMCMSLGIFSYQIFSAIGYRLPIPDLMVVGLMLVSMLVIVMLVMRLVGRHSTRTSETWGCGILSQNSQMEYTASGFSEPILTIFRPIYRTHKKSERTFSDGRQSIFKGGTAEVHTLKVFEEKLYLPLARLVLRFSVKISDLQDVDLDTYILYSFAAIIILLLIMNWVI